MSAPAKRTSALLGVLLLGIVLLPAGCENKGSLRPFDPTELPDAFLHSISADPSMLGLGGRESVLTAYVVDSEGEPAAGVSVS
ncbi:MAG: hypothetical protein EHM19_12705, partial [Candidatus Latescibacterota bacterium]